MRTELVLALMLGLCASTVQAEDAGWADAMVAARKSLKGQVMKKAVPPKISDRERRAQWQASVEKGSVPQSKCDGIALTMWKRFPRQADWFMQDSVADTWADGHADGSNIYHRYLSSDRDADLEKQLVRKVCSEMSEKAEAEAILKQIASLQSGPEDTTWLQLYEKACAIRRAERLKELLAKTQKLVYARHNTFGSFIYFNTEYDGDNGPTGLFELDLSPEAKADGLFAAPQMIFDPGDGIARDPDVHWDGGKMLFAWKKTRKEINTGVTDKKQGPNYQVYEMDLKTKKIRQLTDTKTYGASFEAIYLPNDEILFSSSRIVQVTTCGFGDCSNFYIMNKDGKYARRVGFDQTHTGLPAVLNDGRVIFTRRDYNDRGQAYTHALFQMNPDGTRQLEYYGNNTLVPRSFQSARSIPGTSQVLCIIGGYHTSQGGKLVVLDNQKGMQGFDGLTAVPSGKKPIIRKAPGENFAQEDDLYQNPYPLTEDGFLVSYSPIGARQFVGGFANRNRTEPHVRYNVYWMTLDGRRELLAADPDTSCLQVVPVMKRKRPFVRGSSVDYSKSTGTLFVQDVYKGVGLKGIKPGTIKKLRVVEVLYKPAGMGGIRAQGGKGGSGHSITPVATASGTYDAKKIWGDATVYDDGSAMFRVPARKPLYLQALDKNNQVVQTMRSWLTLMPNESLSCVGCHESNRDAPGTSAVRVTAMSKGVEVLTPFYGKARGFSYIKEIQPILEKHCVSCHNPKGKSKAFLLDSTIVLDEKESRLMTRRKQKVLNKGSYPYRNWLRSYITLTEHDLKSISARFKDRTKWLAYFGRHASPELLRPMRTGSIKSKLIPFLKKGHQKVALSQEEYDKLSAWMDLGVPFCGSYTEANCWDKADAEWFQSRLDLRKRMEDIEERNIKALIQAGRSE